jgi:hypothetical protein
MAAPSPLAVLYSSRTLRPTLPPKQSSDYQVEFGGEIRLACGGGPGIGTHHQQATFRKRPEIPAGQMSQPAPHPVAHHGAAHGTAHHEADPSRLIVTRPAQQVPRDQRPARAVAATHHLRELAAPPHP